MHTREFQNAPPPFWNPYCKLCNLTQHHSLLCKVLPSLPLFTLQGPAQVLLCQEAFLAQKFIQGLKFPKPWLGSGVGEGYTKDFLSVNAGRLTPSLLCPRTQPGLTPAEAYI